MKTAVEYYGYDATELRRVLPNIQRWLDNLPESPVEGQEGLWSCHAICRAVQIKFLVGWEVKDGFFMELSSHSWLQREDKILDVYPVASIATPLLIDLQWKGWRKQYKPEMKVTKSILIRVCKELEALDSLGQIE